MNPDRFAKLKAILLHAQQLREADRQAFLEHACGGDSDLLREAVEVLSENTRTSDLVRTGAFEQMAASVFSLSDLHSDQNDFNRRSNDFTDAMEVWGRQGRERTRNVLHAGDTVGGRYEVVSVLGVGGMGVVYRVHDRLDGVDRALKLASADYYRTKTGLLRFQQEYLAMTNLRHPNLATVLDYGVTEGRSPFLVMDLVEGVTIPTDTPCPLLRFYQIFVQFLRGLSFIHDRGFLHRDVKPSNAILAPSEDGLDVRLVLLDFGIMERIGTTAEQAAGTPAYIAPEVVKQKPLDPRTDIYGLGITAFEILTGQLPFSHHDIRELFAMHERAVRPRASHLNEKVPARLCDLIAAMMAPNPVDRPATAEDVLRTLSTLTDQVQTSDLEARRAYLQVGDLVGRENQMKEARTALDTSGSGKGCCVLIGGMTGSGKSRLMQTIQVEALMRGFAVAGAAIREQHRAPYQTLSTILKGLVPLATSQQVFPNRARVLGRLIPFALKSPSAVEHDRILPHDERGIIIDEVTTWIRQLATRQPVLLLADDLQWCDESSLLVLRSLAGAFGEHRVMLVGAFRSDEVSRGSDLDQWQHSESVELIETPLFTESQTAQFLNSLLGSHSLGRDFVTRAHLLTEGSPFFTIALLHEIIDSNTLVRMAGVWNLAQTDFDVPESVTSLLKQRLDRVGVLAHEIALQLAVANAPVPFDLLTSLLPKQWQDNKAFFAAMEEILRCHLAEIHHGSLRLIHDSLRELIYHGADAAERRNHHQNLGELLVSREVDRDAKAALLGHHFARGNDIRKGLDYLERAGRAAFDAEQHGAARDLLVEVDQLLNSIPQITHRDQRLYDVRKMLTMVCLSYDYDLGEKCGNWVYEAAIKRGGLSSLPWLRRIFPRPWPFLIIMALVTPVHFLLQGREAIRGLRRDLIDIFTVVPALCNCLGSNSKLESSRRNAERLLDFALTRRSLARAIYQIAQLTARYSQVGPAIGKEFERAAAIVSNNPQVQGFDDFTRPMATGVCYYAVAVVDAWEQHPSFKNSFERSDAYAKEHDHQFLHHLNAQVLVEHAMHSGDVHAADDAEALFSVTLQRLGGKSRVREWSVNFAMGQIDIDCGRFDRAEKRQRRLVGDEPGYFTEGLGSLLAARLHVERSQHQRAIEDIQVCLNWARDVEVKSRFLEFRALGVLADIHVAMGKPGEALRAIEDMMPFASEPWHTTGFFLVEALRRRAAALRFTRPTRAVAVARHALEMATRGESQKQLADSYFALGVVLVHDRESHGETEVCWDQARQIYMRLGNTFRANRIEEVARDLG